MVILVNHHPEVRRGRNAILFVPTRKICRLKTLLDWVSGCRIWDNSIRITYCRIAALRAAICTATISSPDQTFQYTIPPAGGRDETVCACRSSGYIGSGRWRRRPGHRSRRDGVREPRGADDSKRDGQRRDPGPGRPVHAAAGSQAAAMTVPAFCRVEATARPTSDSEIKFEVWIPPVDAWNGKFQGVGNGGYRDRSPTRRWPARCAAATPPPAPTPAIPATM